MNQKAVYSIYIGLLAITAITVLFFSNLSVFESTKNFEETRFFGKVYEQWFITRIALDKAFTDVLADISYKETSNGICPSNLASKISVSDIQPYFEVVTNSVSNNSTIECNALNLNLSITGSNPYNATLSMTLNCKASTKNKLNISYSLDADLRKTVSFKQNNPLPPANPSCDVSIEDKDSGKQEISFTKTT